MNASPEAAGLFEVYANDFNFRTSDEVGADVGAKTIAAVQKHLDALRSKAITDSGKRLGDKYTVGEAISQMEDV